MKCPVCGAKLFQKQICKYCKITIDQIETASNRKVKEMRKVGRKDLICYSTVIPNDLSKVKIWLFTFLLGVIGVNHFYILRYGRGTFALTSTVMSLGLVFLQFVIPIYTELGRNIFMVFFEISFICLTINLILWVSDMIALICKSFKIPVVLPQKKKGGYRG